MECLCHLLSWCQSNLLIWRTCNLHIWYLSQLMMQHLNQLKISRLYQLLLSWPSLYIAWPLNQHILQYPNHHTILCLKCLSLHILKQLKKQNIFNFQSKPKSHSKNNPLVSSSKQKNMKILGLTLNSRDRLTSTSLTGLRSKSYLSRNYRSWQISSPKMNITSSALTVKNNLPHTQT